MSSELPFLQGKAGRWVDSSWSQHDGSVPVGWLLPSWHRGGLIAGRGTAEREAGADAMCREGKSEGSHPILDRLCAQRPLGAQQTPQGAGGLHRGAQRNREGGPRGADQRRSGGWVAPGVEQRWFRGPASQAPIFRGAPKPPCQPSALCFLFLAPSPRLCCMAASGCLFAWLPQDARLACRQQTVALAQGGQHAAGAQPFAGFWKQWAPCAGGWGRVLHREHRAEALERRGCPLG